MYRILKYKYPQFSKVLARNDLIYKVNTILNMNKRGFFRKTNFLLAKDYYSMNNK